MRVQDCKSRTKCFCKRLHIARYGGRRESPSAFIQRPRGTREFAKWPLWILCHKEGLWLLHALYFSFTAVNLKNDTLKEKCQPVPANIASVVGAIHEKLVFRTRNGTIHCGEDIDFLLFLTKN